MKMLMNMTIACAKSVDNTVYTCSPPVITYNGISTATITAGPSTQIYYTTNGSTPTMSSTLYTGPITLTDNVTIKAIATRAGWLNSSVTTLADVIESSPNMILSVTVPEGSLSMSLPILDAYIPTGQSLLVNWGDGNSNTYTDTTATANTHTYAAAGSYTVALSGKLTQFGKGSTEWGTTGGTKLTAVKSFGSSLGLTSLSGAFNGCTNLANVPVTIFPSTVLDMSYMFTGATTFNFDISAWDVSSVTNMSYTFSGCTSFNRNIGAWTVTSVANFSYAFSGCTAFNQNIGVWDTAAATNMSYMFNGCTIFNQDIGSWNTSLVTNMQSMFYNAAAFNQDISWLVGSPNAWNVKAVTNLVDFATGAATFSAANYDLFLKGLHQLAIAAGEGVQTTIKLNVDTAYSSVDANVIAAVAYLADTKRWVICPASSYAVPVLSHANNSHAYRFGNTQNFTVSVLSGTIYSYQIGAGSVVVQDPGVKSISFNGIADTGTTDYVEIKMVSYGGAGKYDALIVSGAATLHHLHCRHDAGGPYTDSRWNYAVPASLTYFYISGSLHNWSYTGALPTALATLTLDNTAASGISWTYAGALPDTLTSVTMRGTGINWSWTSSVGLSSAGTLSIFNIYNTRTAGNLMTGAQLITLLTGLASRAGANGGYMNIGSYANASADPTNASPNTTAITAAVANISGNTAEQIKYWLNAVLAKPSTTTIVLEGLNYWEPPVASAATNIVANTSFKANWSSVIYSTKYFIDVATDSGFTTFLPGYENKELGVVLFLTVLATTGTYYYRVRAGSATQTTESSNTITVTVT